MRIAGVYASAFLFYFFIFKLLCAHKDAKQIFYICAETGNKIFYLFTETRNSKNYTPGLQIQIRIPPSSLSRHKLVHLQQVAGIMPN